MPRVRYGIPPKQRQIEDELRERYGGMMSAVSVGAELGLKHHIAYETWLSDIKPVNVNGRKRWRVADVAEKIYRGME